MTAAGVLCLLLIGAPSDPEIEAAARRVLADPQYQSELPGRDTPSVDDDSDAGGRAPRDERPRIGRAAASVLRFVWWFVVAVVAAVGLTWLFRELALPRLARRSPEEEAPSAPSPAPASRPSAEALAAQGRFDEAIHALLLDVLDRRVSAPAWTARESLRRLQLETDARTVLRELVVVVERTLFAGERAGEADYVRCRERSRGLREGAA